MHEVKIEFSGLKFLSILNFECKKEINEHGHAAIRGHITEEMEKKISAMAIGGETAEIFAVDESGERQLLFRGLIEQFKVKNTIELKLAEIELVSGTKMMDVVEHTRTFQDESISYGNLLEIINANYTSIDCIQECNTKKNIGKFIVQYEETDWEFVRRLASLLHTCVYPVYNGKSAGYSFGISEKNTVAEIDTVEYVQQSNTLEYKNKTENGLSDYYYTDASSFQVKSRELYEIGQSVTLNRIKLYIYQIHSKLIGEELIHQYELRSYGGFQQIQTYNKYLIGASLPGMILGVTKDKVKVHIGVDAKQEESSARWFPFSTIYSSPDGTGWYCMPEPGDRVRIYFPNEKEEDSYAISAIHVSQGTVAGEARSNPDNKSISTKYGKQVELTPTTISVTNNNGMSVTLDDEMGVSIVSDKDIVIQSENILEICSVADSVQIEGTESIEFIQGENKFIMKDDISMHGGTVKIQ